MGRVNGQARIANVHRSGQLDVPGGRRVDAASIKLNHKVHLKPDLKGPKGPVQLACRDCHLPAEDGVRMATVEEIIAMMVDVVQRCGRKNGLLGFTRITQSLYRCYHV